MGRATPFSPSQIYLLNRFGDIIQDEFEETAFLVGSCVLGGAYRDIDIRVCVDADAKLCWLTDQQLHFIGVAISRFAERFTTLEPIDFQFQRAEEFHGYDGPLNRRPLFSHPHQPKEKPR